MTIYTSQMINQMMAQQTAMFAGQAQYANMIGMRQIAPPTGAFDVSARQTGMFGEQVAAGMMGAARGMAGVGMAGLGVAGALTGIPFDPISAAFAGGSAGMRFGIGGAMLGAGAAALPMMAVTSYAGALGQNFAGGFQDQLSLNSTLRNNFQFFGGSGPMGRGFSQQQMGSIGNVVAGQLRSNPFTSSGELSQLIAGGADMGLFSNTRDVQTFSQNFRRMISTLRDVQRELGGSLQEAQNFVRQSQQSGIYNSNDQAAFAARIRTAVATTGMNQDQVMQLSSMGASMARAAGGRGYQGALGAARTATQLGSAIQGGYLSQELLSEATGGLQGSEAVQAFTARLMSVTDRFSRTGAGRYMTFAGANADGSGLDAASMAEIRGGAIGVSEIRRRAQHNVNRMGRARALNQEGFLRGAQLEEGGLSGALGYLRQAMGDQMEDMGNERAQYFMRRRFGFSQTEAQAVSQLMRNQGNIAVGEMITNQQSSREAGFNREVSENRSFEGFTRQLEHGLSDNLGMTRARELGRTFATRISSAVERGFNAMMGLSEQQLGRESQMAMARLSIGQASGRDRARLQSLFQGNALVGSGFDANAESMSDRTLHALGMHARGSISDQMASRGDSLFGQRNRADQIHRVTMAGLARQGYVEGGDLRVLEQMTAVRPDVLSDISQAQIRARGGGHSDNWYQYMRGVGAGNANATDAFLASINARDAQGRAPTMDQAMSGSGGIGAGLDAMFQTDRYGNAMNFLAGGGHLAGSLRERARALRGMERRTEGDSPLDERNREAFFTGEAGRLRSMARGLRVDEGVMRGVLGEGAFGDLFRQSVALSETVGTATTGKDGDNGAMRSMRESFTGMREAAMRMGGDERAAALGVVSQMEHSLKTTGRLGTEFTTVAQGDPAQMRAAMEARLRTSGDLRGLSASLGQVAGGERVSALLSGMSQNYAMGGADAVNQIQTGSMDVMRELAGMSPEQRAAMYERMGTTEQGQLMMQQSIQYRQVDRDLSGRGRRGARGARDTAAELISGGSIGDMSFSVGNDRTRSGRQGLEQALQRDPSRARAEYVEQMVAGGATAEGAGRMFDYYREAASSTNSEGGRRVQFSAAERHRMQELAAETGVGEVQQRRSMDAARAANPLMAQVSRTLEEIRDRLPQPAAAQEAAQLARESRGFLSTIAQNFTDGGETVSSGES